jgi:hypothetical protein
MPERFVMTTGGPYPIEGERPTAAWYEEQVLAHLAEAMRAVDQGDPARADRAIRIGGLYAQLLDAAIRREAMPAE